MPPAPEAFWLQRWNALYQAMSATAASYPEEKTLVTLLEELMNFGNIQFFYFYFGFSHRLLDKLESGSQPPVPATQLLLDTLPGIDASDAQDPPPIVALAQKALDHFDCLDGDRLQRAPQRLRRDDELPPDYVLRTIVDKVAYDYNEIIKPAIHQRRHGTPAEKETLRLADRWGQSLLAPLGSKAPEGMERVLAVDPVVITYFNHSPMIRMIPYAAVALVGIPPTASSPGNRRDLLILPHELGHYIYWHGRFSGELLHKHVPGLLADQPPFLRRWIQEIFADVCGLIISHEPAVLPAALSMIRDNAPRNYLADNQIHPIDAVRLDIYLSAIKLLELVFGLDELEHIWSIFENKIHDFDLIAGGRESVPVSGQDGEEMAVELKGARNTVSFSAMFMAGPILKPALAMQQWPKRLLPGAATEEVEDLLTSPDIPDLPPSTSLPKTFPEHLRRSGVAPPVTLGAFSEFFPRFLDAINGILANAQIQDWFAGFEERMDKLAGPGEEAGAPDLVRYSQLHPFEKIRDGHSDETLAPSQWQEVLAAGGWAIKGPETGPVGGWEEEPDWVGSALHP